MVKAKKRLDTTKQMMDQTSSPGPRIQLVQAAESAAKHPPPPTTRYSWQNARPLPTQLYITEADDADAALSSFKGPCGIDIEWKPSFRKGEKEHPVALLQLVNNDTIVLLHLCRMQGGFPKNLKTLLEDSAIVKAGVGIQGDAKKLYKDCAVNLRNCVDLSLLARSVDNPRWKGKYGDPIGLARLIAAYEDRLLQKGRITRSNWENRLDTEQREYASNGLALYTRLHLMLTAMDNPPNPNCYTFDAVRGRLCEPSGIAWVPYNPDYDPGPPPPPKDASESSNRPNGVSSRPRKRPFAPETSSDPSAQPVLTDHVKGRRRPRRVT
ncbi:ribonuclease H-like domain-containing protein [Mycena filopes]|nr:ribonuclease H-like domain-containing protein [Mycena filopes]